MSVGKDRSLNINKKKKRVKGKNKLKMEKREGRKEKYDTKVMVGKEISYIWNGGSLLRRLYR